MKRKRHACKLAVFLAALAAGLLMAGSAPVGAASAVGTSGATVLPAHVVSLSLLSLPSSLTALGSVVPAPNVLALAGLPSPVDAAGAGSDGAHGAPQALAFAGGAALGEIASTLLQRLAASARLPLAAAPLAGDGRMVVVLSQASTDAPNAIALTVNFN